MLSKVACVIFGAIALGAVAAAAPGGFHGGGQFRGGMPSPGFHGVPNGFHGGAAHGTFGGGPIHHGFGRPGHDFSTFNGHHFSQFAPGDHQAWQGGNWRHTMHDGHYGWWWTVGSLWYFYPAPIYPYPAYIGPDYYYDYNDEFGPPPNYWYYCEDPPGYFPYVQHCNSDWEPVPPTDGH